MRYYLEKNRYFSQEIFTQLAMRLQSLKYVIQKLKSLILKNSDPKKGRTYNRPFFVRNKSEC